MKQTVRFKTFETNSSSYHSCCILTDEEYKQYQSGNMLLSKWGDDELVTKESVLKEFEEHHFKDYFEDWLEQNGTPVIDKETNEKMYVLSDETAHTLEECEQEYRKEYIKYDIDAYMRDNGYESYDSDSEYEQDHTIREINGVKIHALCDYGYDY